MLNRIYFEKKHLYIFIKLINIKKACKKVRCIYTVHCACECSIYMRMYRDTRGFSDQRERKIYGF